MPSFTYHRSCAAAWNGVVVADQTVGEGVRVGLVVGFGRSGPGIEVFAVAAGEHFGEGRHVRG
jgi:hypothetical protein